MAKFLEKLSSLHCDVGNLLADDVKWMWEVEELPSFLDWFAQYIDDSNCINNSHISTYLELCQDGKVLEGEELNHALQGYGVDVQSFLYSDLSEWDVELYDEELKELKAQYESAEEIESLLIEESERALVNEQAADGHLKTAQISCQKEGQNLMKINASLKATISSFYSGFSKLITAFKDSDDPDILNSCISNMSLANPINTCERFNEYANLCLKRKFEQPCFSDKPISELVFFLEDESSQRNMASFSSNMTSNLPNKMWKAEVNRIALQGTLNGLNAAIHHLKNLRNSTSFEKINPLQMKLEAAKLKDEVVRLTESIGLVLKHEAGNVVVDAISYDISNVVGKILRARIERRQIMLEELCLVNNVIHEFLLTTDLLWMFISHESQKFKLGLELLKEVSDFYTEEINRHEATMNGLKSLYNEHNQGADALRNGQAQLLSTVQTLLSYASSECDGVINSTLTDTQLQRDQLIQVSDVLVSLQKLHPNREKSIYELLMELMRGPTKKPNLVSKELVQAIQNLETHLNKSKSEMANLSSMYSTKKLLFKKSPVVKNRRLLWAWFLVAPEKLEDAMNLALEESSRRDK